MVTVSDDVIIKLSRERIAVFNGCPTYSAYHFPWHIGGVTRKTYNHVAFEDVRELNRHANYTVSVIREFYAVERVTQHIFMDTHVRVYYCFSFIFLNKFIAFDRILSSILFFLSLSLSISRFYSFIYLSSFIHSFACTVYISFSNNNNYTLVLFADLTSLLA